MCASSVLRRRCTVNPHFLDKVPLAHKGLFWAQGGIDPSGIGATMIATDVMWSDPVAEPGLRTNDARGVGLVFGPDATQVRPGPRVYI